MWDSILNELRDQGFTIQPGLSLDELQRIEEQFGFLFPPDLSEFLQTGLPRGDGFPDWRSDDEATLQRWLDLPKEGILFDIEFNHFWLPEWGPRPESLEEAKRVATELIDHAPRLIPIYNHRMIPAEPHERGNPVFSVHQADIIYYGIDLRDYFVHEFYAQKDIGIWPIPDRMRKIRFWDIERFLKVRWGWE